MIASTALVYPDVKLGENCIIEDYCIIGVPVAGHKKVETIIGDNAVIRSHTVIYAGNIIGNNFMTGNKANIRELNEIGNNVSIGTMSVIEYNTKISDNVRIHSHAFIPEFTVLGRGCWIGPNVVITNDRYPKSPADKKKLQAVNVNENAKIGANVTILPGVIIGKNSLVGAGSVVTHNVKENSIYSGNPARFFRNIHY
ncbi:MAG: acyltransferase [Spirochaetota bacterium]